MSLVLLVVIVYGIISGYILVKNDNTLKQQCRMLDAIGDYNISAIHSHEFDSIIDYSNVEPYNKTLFRLWDWGYKRIVPPEVFDRIKPYIK